MDPQSSLILKLPKKTCGLEDEKSVPVVNLKFIF